MSVNPKIMYSLLPIMLMSLQVKAETSGHASEHMIPHGALVEVCPFSDRYGNLRKIRSFLKMYFRVNRDIL